MSVQGGDQGKICKLGGKGAIAGPSAPRESKIPCRCRPGFTAANLRSTEDAGSALLASLGTLVDYPRYV